MQLPGQQRGTSLRRKQYNDTYTSNRDQSIEYPDKKTIQKLEEGISHKLNEYNGRMMLGGGGTLDFGAVAVKTESREAKEREMVPPSFSILDDVSTISTNDVNGDGPSIADLYATEESYSNLAKDFKSLVLGLANEAELLCNAKRENDNSDDKSKPFVKVTNYQETVMRAEKYLEAFETLYRIRSGAVAKSKLALEDFLRNEEDAAKSSEGKSGGGTKVFGTITSFLGDVFSSPLQSASSSATTNDFDNSWKSADGTKLNTNDIQGLKEVTPANFDEMILAHKNMDLIPNLTLYEHVLSANQASYCFGRKAKEEAAERSNRLLNRWVSLNCLHKPVGANWTPISSSNATKAAKSASSQSHYEVQYPEQNLFHSVMRQYADLSTVDGTQRAEEWLQRMQTLKQSGWKNCGPDVHAYNLVLLGFCSLTRAMRHREGGKSQLVEKSSSDGNEFSKNIDKNTKQFIIDGVERVLLELNNQTGEGIEPNVLSLNLTLNAIAKAGRDKMPGVCQKTDRLLFKVLGEDTFRTQIVGVGNQQSDDCTSASGDPSMLMDEVQEILNGSPTHPAIEPNLDTYHWLVDIYSSGDITYIKRGLVILKKMIELRIAEDSSRSTGTRSDNFSFAPSTGTFNNVLRALQFKVDELSEISSSPSDFSAIDVATEVTELLDAMVQYESSLPTRVTFLFVLQMWTKTASQEAGERAEEIMSRMEVVSTYQDEIRPFSNAYKLAFQCWHTSAKAGRIGAVDRAAR
jgi:hypothetical protein